MSLSINTAIASPLLSRFDLVLTLIDSRNGEWDKLVSDYILNMREFKAEAEVDSDRWSIAKWQAYFNHIRRLQPLLGVEANKILARYYQRQRQTDGADMARTTVRLLQSCVRIAQGHARLMMRSEVTTQDAVMAVLLLESSTESSASLIKGQNILHSAFPADPLKEYLTQARMILTGLGLTEIWQEEWSRVEELRRSEASGSSKEFSSKSDDTQPSEQTDFTQVLKIIQKNKAPVIPAPEIKRKRRSKGNKKDESKRKKVEEREVEIHESSDQETEDDEAVDETSAMPNLCSTLMETSPSNQERCKKDAESGEGCLDLDLSPIVQEKNQKNSKISEKTKAKLDLFKRIDTDSSGGKENDIKERSVITSDRLKASKESLKSSLLAAANLAHKANKQAKVITSNLKTKSWRMEEEDLDFDFDL